MTIFITGAAGFSGKCLNKHINSEKVLLARPQQQNSEELDKFVLCDLLDADKVSELIAKYKPEKIFHLAGSFTNDYEQDYKANVISTKNILEAVKEHCPTTRVLLVGSAAEYGMISQEQCPVKESLKLNPFNIYGLTKINQVTLMDYYVNVHALNIVMARPFNLYGRGISPRLFIGKVYQDITLLKEGVISEIALGNLDSARDYISIEDAIKHYIKIMDVGTSGEAYNVASGKPTKIKDILSTILAEEALDLSVVKANTRDTQANDSDIIFADISKLEGLYND